jgi:hypothetical protein
MWASKQTMTWTGCGSLSESEVPDHTVALSVLPTYLEIEPRGRNLDQANRSPIARRRKALSQRRRRCSLAS